MAHIDAMMLYDEHSLHWGKSLRTIRALAGCYEVGIRFCRKTLPGEEAYYSITISADARQSLDLFIASLFNLIGESDSPIFYVSVKMRVSPPLQKMAKTTPLFAACAGC